MYKKGVRELLGWLSSLGLGKGGRRAGVCITDYYSMI